MQFGDIGGASESVKTGVDSSANRQAREQVSVQIRKGTREEHLKQRRRPNEGPQAARSPIGTEEIPTKDIPAFAQVLLTTSDPAVQEKYTTYFRKVLSVKSMPPVTEVITAGVVPKLVEFLQRTEHEKLQFEAAWALTNIASGESMHTQHVIEAGAVPVFVALLRSPNRDVREQSIWALGNIAGDNEESRDIVHAAGAMPLLLEQFSPENFNSVKGDNNNNMILNATWTLRNFCRGKRPPRLEILRPALIPLRQLIYHPKSEILYDALCALHYIAEGGNKLNDRGQDGNLPDRNVQAVIEAGVVPRLVELLVHLDNQIKTMALRTIGTIAGGDEEQTQHVINNGGLYGLLALLKSESKDIRKEACWIISNITTGPQHQLQAVIDSKMFPRLIDMLGSEAEFDDVKKECMYAICNPAINQYIPPQQLVFIAECKCIPPLCTYLEKRSRPLLGGDGPAPSPEILRKVRAEVFVLLSALRTFVALGAKLAEETGSANKYAQQILETAHGMDVIEGLKDLNDANAKQRVAALASDLYAEIEDSFPNDDDDDGFDDDDDDDDGLVPEHSSTSGQQHFTFGQQYNTPANTNLGTGAFGAPRIPPNQPSNPGTFSFHGLQ